jgi:hypothetical protein
MAFLPVEEVTEEFLNTLTAPSFPEDHEISEKVDLFIEYFKTNWLGETARVAKPAIWNVHNIRDNRRTNNGLEAWHKQIAIHCGGAHRNFYDVMQAILDEQDWSEVKITRLIAGEPVAASTPNKVLIKYNKINSALAEYQNNMITQQVFFMRVLSLNTPPAKRRSVAVDESSDEELDV